MRLHRNAALSLKGRELLVDRVLCQSWRLADAAGAAESASALALSGSRGFVRKASRDSRIDPQHRRARPLGCLRSVSR
jgi:hypothetical protein